MEWNLNCLRAIAELRTPLLDTLMQGVTELGGETLFMLFMLVVFWCVDKNKGYFLMLLCFTGTAVNQMLKITFCIPRPWVLDPSFEIVESARAGATGFSFRRRRLRRDVLHHEKALGARGVHGAGAAHSLFAAVSRRSHAARRRRIVPDRLAAGAGVLSSARGDRPPRRGARTHLAHPARTGGAVPALCASRPRGHERRRGQL